MDSLFINLKTKRLRRRRINVMLFIIHRNKLPLFMCTIAVKDNIDDNIRFHSFPLKNKDLLKKWLIDLTPLYCHLTKMQLYIGYRRIHCQKVVKEIILWNMLPSNDINQRKCFRGPSLSHSFERSRRFDISVRRCF